MKDILKFGVIAAVIYLIWRYFLKPSAAGQIGAPVASAEIPGIGKLDLTRTKTELANEVVARLKLPTADTAAKKTQKKGVLKKFGNWLKKSKVGNVVKGVVTGAVNLVAPGAGTAIGKIL